MGFKMKPKSPLTKKLVSALKHKPWAAAHKERPAHSGTAEAHNAEPAAPTKKYVSDAQRKAVHASKADGGKGAPTKKREKKDFGTGDKKTERKLNRINRKMQKQHNKQFDNEDKGTKRGDRRADKAHAKGRKLLAKGRAIKKAADERNAESPAKLKKPDPSKTRVGPDYADKIRRDREREEFYRKEFAKKMRKRAQKNKKEPTKAEKKTQ